MNIRKPTLTGASILAMLSLSACATSSVPDEPDSTPHDMSDVTSMNDPDATPASDINGAETGRFQVLPSAPPGSEGVTGQAWLAQGPQSSGTTATIELQGLEPDADYLAHLHTEPCSTDDGGEHFRFDPAGSDMPPNEIHLGIAADENGAGGATTSNSRPVRNRAPSVVIHPVDLPDNRLACADFEAP